METVSKKNNLSYTIIIYFRDFGRVAQLARAYDSHS